MNAVYKTTCLFVCFTLFGCGNKGDLFLKEVELTEEQKVMLEQLEVDKAKKKNQNELDSDRQNDLPSTN